LKEANTQAPTNRAARFKEMEDSKRWKTQRDGRYKKVDTVATCPELHEITVEHGHTCVPIGSAERSYMRQQHK
jgi:hypothetical protein